MASGDLSNQVPIIPGGAYLKDTVIGGMPGPLPDSQQRHWIPDERDNFISWLRGEFAAANAIIDSLCHHLQTTGKPNEYDFVLHCIHQRRYNWTVVLHMQQYFSVAEVVFALQQVVWMKQALNSDPSGQQHPPLYVSPENGGGPPWKEGPAIYRDPGMVPGAAAVYHNFVPEEPHLGRKEAADVARKSEEPKDRRRNDSRDQERQQQLAVPPPIPIPIPEPSSYANDIQTDPADQATSGITTNRSDSSLSEMSTVQSASSPSQRLGEPNEEKLPDQGSREQGDRDGSSSTKLEGSEVLSSEKSSTDSFQSAGDDDQRIANIKTTKGYSCMEQLDGKMVNTLDGLELHEKVFDKFESTRLINFVQDIRAAGKRGELGGGVYAGSKKGAKGNGREILHFGHSHHEDHKRRSSPKDDFVPPVPAFLEAIIDRLVRWHVIPASKRPDCCSINIMEEGDYLPPHVDYSYLERPYCTLVLQSECTLILGQSLTTSAPGDFRGPFQISAPVGSVVVFQKNSADVAKHSIPTSPSKRIVVTLGKVLPSRPARSYNNNPSGGGISQSPPIPVSSSWSPSFNHNTNNRPGNNFQHNTSSRAGGGGGGFAAPFKSHKYAPVTSSSQSSSGGVLPNPTARPPPPAQIITNVANPVPPLFSGTPGPPAGGAFPPPSMPIPTWSPLPRPPPPSRPPSAGTGVFFPSSGASSGPGRPVNMAPPRRSGSNVPSGPPVLQKTNSAPASFASLEVAAIAAAAATAASPSNPPSKSSKTVSITTTGSLEKVAPVLPAARGLSPGPASTQDSNVGSGKAPSSDVQSEANGVKSAVKEEIPAARSSGRSSKSSGGGSSSRPNAVNTGGGHS
ncbi:unnamed protein product [Calypogeia fissa]